MIRGGRAEALPPLHYVAASAPEAYAVASASIAAASESMVM